MEPDREGNLTGIRVVELADEQAEYAGRLFSGLGAEVIKIEPPGGNSTRKIGPFFEDKDGPERSLFFWNYNLGKKSVVLDLTKADDVRRLGTLLETADVFLESTPRGYLDSLGLGKDALLERYPALIVARISPFGDEGPWADYKGSDLVHLALGGPMMNTGYDPRPDGTYDTPPIAGQAWHAFHIAGEQLTGMVIGALLYRKKSGRGQYVTCPIHQAVSCNTELDVMTWVYRHAPYYRQTCRHAGEVIGPPSIGMTKDGRWIMAGAGNTPKVAELLARYGMDADLKEKLRESAGEAPPVPGGATAFQVKGDPFHVTDIVHRFLRRVLFEEAPWGEAQDAGLQWVPLRVPEENIGDEHWRLRGLYGEVKHPELERSFDYLLAKWKSSETDWRRGPRAPLVGEHTDEVLSRVSVPTQPAAERPVLSSQVNGAGKKSRWGKPFALENVRILDFTWYLATGGGPRYLSALGAESIKVEFKSNLDLRVGFAQYPVGGREARERATAPLEPDLSSVNKSGQFNDWRAGQRGISLNVRHPKGLEIAKKLVSMVDIVSEGFSPGVLARWGLTYDVMREIKPDIIYISQSGFGSSGIYGRYRTGGPMAASVSGISEMSGLPMPYPPAGWGYSFLDWFGAYHYAMAMLSALYYRERTGKGQWIDSSQVELGMFLTGTSVLDWTANGRAWKRYGNRSPFKPAAPHGAYRCQGADRWIAIACFTEDEWSALASIAGHQEWRTDPRFRTLTDRLGNQDELDRAVNAWTQTQDAFELMHRLQAAGVGAGVCQDAEDRCDHDPQLAALNWFTEVDHTEMGRWPVKEVPVHMSETPPFMGGPIDRAAPCYGEDNTYVFQELLGMTSAQVAELVDEGVI